MRYAEVNDSRLVRPSSPHWVRGVRLMHNVWCAEHRLPPARRRADVRPWQSVWSGQLVHLVESCVAMAHGRLARLDYDDVAHYWHALLRPAGGRFLALHSADLGTVVDASARLCWRLALQHLRDAPPPPLPPGRCASCGRLFGHAPECPPERRTLAPLLYEA